MVHVSTGGFKNLTASAAAKMLHSEGIDHVELSGGVYSESVRADLLSLKSLINFRVHNYFPPPKEKFVLNLASLDSQISERCLDFCEESIKLAHVLEGKYYSFHAGFLIDPKPQELGQKVQKRALFDRDQALEKFFENINKLAKIAAEHEITLLIENNVLSAVNYKEFGEDPLLFTSPNETRQFMKTVPNNVKLLLDVAHLKVSAQTLKFDKDLWFSECHEWVAGYHLSDNNGFEDSNEKIDKDSWFWNYLKKDLDYFVVEVYTANAGDLKNQISLVKRMIQ